MRFLADESVSGVVTARLLAEGVDVTTPTSVERGSHDKYVLERAQSGDLALITKDRDFGELVVRRGLPIIAVLLLKLDELSNASEADRVLAVISAEGDAIAGHFVVIEPGRVRKRPLQSS